jgi:uncharacterized protein YggE
MSEDTASLKPAKNRVNVSLDLRIVVAVLLVTILAMLFMWKPWTTTGVSDRTVEVTGEATVKAEPDEFVFYPTYQYKSTDKDAALAEATKKHDEVIKKLKELGVADNKIKSDTSGFDREIYMSAPDRVDSTSYSSTITITVDSREMAQKVQDYLVTTTPTGSVSPQATFSDAKRKELESKARDEATKDARAKAEQSGKNLGFKVGKVKTVTDGSGFSGIEPAMGRTLIAEDSMSSDMKLSIQPGENELSYTVTVVYYVR